MEKWVNIGVNYNKYFNFILFIKLNSLWLGIEPRLGDHSIYRKTNVTVTYFTIKLSKHIILAGNCFDQLTPWCIRIINSYEPCTLPLRQPATILLVSLFLKNFKEIFAVTKLRFVTESGGRTLGNWLKRPALYQLS